MDIRTFVFVLVMIAGFGHTAAHAGVMEGGATIIRPVNGIHKFIHNGRERTYFLYLPGAYSDSASLPLVIALHGGGGSAKKWPAYTNSGFERLAEKEPFILVYPEGLRGNWNDEREYPASYAHTHDIDDVGFLIALIDYLLDTYSIDRSRVYVTGASNGGMMAHYLAAMASDRIAAIATVISTMPRNLIGRLNPDEPVSVLMINGTDDPLVPWGGGPVKFGKRVNGYVTSVEDTVKFWVDKNKCNPGPMVSELPDRDRSDGTVVSKTAYSGGRQNTEVVLYTVHNGGHTWPSFEDKGSFLRKILVSRLVGRKSRDIDACEVVWNFFRTHPKKIR